MTKLWVCAVGTALLLAMSSTAAFAAADELLFDAQPVTLDGRTMVPLRPIFEWVGAKVTYDGGHIQAYRSETAMTPLVELWIGSTQALIAETNRTLDVAPQLIQGRAFVPLRFVAESFGVWVDAEGRQMRLSLPQEERVAVMAVPPHPQAHLGKIWRVIERWYDLLPPEEETPNGGLAHWNLYAQERQQEIIGEIGADAPGIVEAHWGGRQVMGIRVLDGRVSPGAETGWAEVLVGYGDGEKQVERFDLIREPTGWKVLRHSQTQEAPRTEITGSE